MLDLDKGEPLSRAIKKVREDKVTADRLDRLVKISSILKEKYKMTKDSSDTELLDAVIQFEIPREINPLVITSTQVKQTAKKKIETISKGSIYMSGKCSLD